MRFKIHLPRQSAGEFTKGYSSEAGYPFVRPPRRRNKTVILKGAAFNTFFPERFQRNRKSNGGGASRVPPLTESRAGGFSIDLGKSNPKRVELSAEDFVL